MEAIIDYRGHTPKKSAAGIPLITAKIVKKGRLLDSDLEYIAPEYYDEWMQRGLPLPGDIVMTTEAPLGEIAQLDGKKVALGQRIITLRGKPNLLDNTYLKFLMLSDFIQHQLYAHATGTTVQGIRQSEVRKIMLLIPPFSEQEAIARILGSLDDKIELNHQMNKTLEAIAQTIFKSWFIDFDPVRAKMEACEPYGMDAETVALFPDGFEDSVLGKIPRGWKVEYLPKVIDVNPARSLVKGEFAPYLEMSNMPTSSARAIQWETREFTSGMKFINGDTLLARITPCLENGKTAYVDFLLEGQVGWGSTEYIVFHSKEQLPPEYTYFLARSEDLRAHAIKNMTGTSGRQRVPAECFNSYSIVVPQQEIAWKFGEIAKICLAAIKQRDEETNILASLRDTLLPKLISGQVRVKDAEKIAEALPSVPVHDKSREIIQGRLFS